MIWGKLWKRCPATRQALLPILGPCCSPLPKLQGALSVILGSPWSRYSPRLCARTPSLAWTTLLSTHLAQLPSPARFSPGSQENPSVLQPW